MDAKLGLNLSEIDRLLQLARTFQIGFAANSELVCQAICDLAKAVDLLAKMIEWQTLKGTR